MIKKIVLGLVTALLLVLVALGLYFYFITVDRPDATPETVVERHRPGTEAEGASAEAWLTEIYTANAVPSLSAAVGVGGELVWSATIGYSDLSQRTLADSRTRYNIGSISKPLTAAAALRLQDRGLLHVDQPFDAYVDDFASGNTSYTIKQLLSHQAGVRHYSQSLSEQLNTTEYADARAAAAIVEKDPLAFQPGNGFSYSTYGYNLAALAMERAAGEPFARIMQTEVFDPAGMTATHFYRVAHAEQDSSAAARYWSIAGMFMPAPDLNLSDRYAGGGYASTPRDLVRFGNALLDDRFISTESTHQLWTAVPLASGEMNSQNYGLGFRIGEDEFGRYVHHGGISNGGYGFFLMYPDDEIVVAFASNTTPMDPTFNRVEEARKLANVFRPLSAQEAP